MHSCYYTNNLTYSNLSFNNLHGDIPIELSHLPHLQVLLALLTYYNLHSYVIVES